MLKEILGLVVLVITLPIYWVLNKAFRWLFMFPVAFLLILIDYKFNTKLLDKFDKFITEIYDKRFNNFIMNSTAAFIVDPVLKENYLNSLKSQLKD